MAIAIKESSDINATCLQNFSSFLALIFRFWLILFFVMRFFFKQMACIVLTGSF